MDTQKPIIEKDHVVIKFAGDSGDGMQLTGSQFSDTSALMGNEVVTFPDYPAEIRAPKGTIGGVSGFQVNVGKTEVNTPGDYVDVLVVMNPAALKANMHWLKKGGTLIADKDSFTEKNMEKVGCNENPFESPDLDGMQVIAAPITTLTSEALADVDIDRKEVLRSRNMVALGLVYWLFQRDISYTEDHLREKFAKKTTIADANIAAMKAGYNYGENLQYIRAYKVNRAKIDKGTYRNINGNIATAWGLLAAAEKANLQLFLGSYPITPASEILQEISYRKDLGAISFQAEDEIAGIATSIGAAFTGKFACTSTSGPGLALKSEAINLAIITELPIVIVDVQRGGPSTGLPTKPEQSDLLQALYGRNGDSPIPVIAASSPSNCFRFAFDAGKIALENMTPVLLLTDGFIANGSKPWKIMSMDELPEIKTRFKKLGDETYMPYARLDGTMIREWAVPGMKGYEHRIGGLEKMAVTGGVSYEPMNHQVMTDERFKKVENIQEQIPLQEVDGEEKGKVLVVGWGGTYGHILTAMQELREEGIKDVSYTHFNYIYPLPKNTNEIFSKFDKILVCELNNGQFFGYLRSVFPEHNYQKFNKIQGYPFTIGELKSAIKNQLEG
ncbi:MAG: 2-oxoacid:acceptor oxidoreductase subunit alpha [Bacteroidales bacterium]|nr:2-oxoacid:acceptor oxidoreductase subunit alpha [Bacteroidales bacterium]